MNQFDILQSLSITSDAPYLSVSDRYYEHKYCTMFSTAEKNLDQRVSFHTNRVCMISLAENHPVMKEKKVISKINCVVNKIDRLANVASGKGKRGAQKLSQNSILCYIECDDGTSYPVYSCIKGKLLEVNENLLTKPHLIIDKPTSDGYIALILPRIITSCENKDSMLSQNEYFANENTQEVKNTN